MGGIVFGSLALIADAAHLLSDVAGLGIALAGLTLAARPISTRHSFGFARAEVMAAQLSALLLLAAGGWILFEGVARFFEPEPVNGGGLAVVATVGLVVNLGSALLVHRAQTGWLQADSVVSIATALLVLWAGWKLLRDTIHVLMEGTPQGMDTGQVRTSILALDTVVDVHHLHLWNLASDVPTLSAHVVITGEPTLRHAQQSATQIRAALADAFDLTHVTLELECPPPDIPPTNQDNTEQKRVLS